jgi:ribosomal subunit interface protein
MLTPIRKEFSMQHRIFFGGCERTKVFDDHLTEQLKKIERFLDVEPSPRIIEVNVHFHANRSLYEVRMRVKTRNYECFAEHSGTDYYAEINEVVDRIYTQLRNQNQKLNHKHKQGCGKECRAHAAEEAMLYDIVEDDEQ